MTSWTKLMTVILSLLSLHMTVASAQYVEFNTFPEIVQSKAAQLILSFNLATSVNKGGWLYLSLPNHLTLEATASNCREEAGLLELLCTIETDKNRIKFVPDRTVKAGEAY